MNNPRTKILMVTTSDRIAGAEKNIYDLVRLIDRTKYDIRFIVLKHEPPGHLVEKIRELGVSAECLYIQSKWQLWKLFRLWRMVREFRPDILESFLYFDNQICRIIGKLARIPVVISGLQNIQTAQPWWKKMLDRYTLRFADAVISNTETGKHFYANLHPGAAEKMFVARGGIDLELLREMQGNHVRTVERTLFNITIPADHHVLLAVGFLAEQKGITYLLQSLQQLKNKGRKVSCFIVGIGALEESLKHEAIERGVDNVAHFVGYQNASYQYLPLVDIFVLPSLWEGLPNVVIEALASRVPVVSTRVGGVGELITDGATGFLVPPGDADAFAHAIERVMDLPADERLRILDAAYQHIVTSFTTDSMVAGYTTCYKHLLKIP